MNIYYFNPKDTAGYSSVQKLHEKVKDRKSFKQVQNWLSNQLAYSLNKPIRKKFPTRSYKVAGVNELWQMDLMEMIPFARINNGNKYILNCIDVFSRFARSQPVKSKSGIDIAKAIEKMFKSAVPINVQTDMGKEFYNKHVQSLFKKYNINHYSVTSQYKAAIVERFNRTLRSKLNKYFVYTGKKLWYNVLQDFVDSYNKTRHRGIGFRKPCDINPTNEATLWIEKDKANYAIHPPKFGIGDYVRISKISASPFVKNFDSNWSDEVFQVDHINKHDNPIMYTIKDLNGEVIKGKFYNQELQKLSKLPNVFRIERIIRSRGKGQNKQYLVKWVGYKEPSWIHSSQIV